jgi:hypothetical protein
MVLLERQYVSTARFIPSELFIHPGCCLTGKSSGGISMPKKLKEVITVKSRSYDSDNPLISALVNLVLQQMEVEKRG